MNAMKIAIIGCGRMGKERARSATACGASVASVYDPDRDRANALAALYPGSQVIDDPLQAIGKSDALFVCTPPVARGPVELAAIDARLPFFVEKPVGVSASGHSRQILDRLSSEQGPARGPSMTAGKASTPDPLFAVSLKSTSLVHAVGYQNRCRSSIQHARTVLQGRTILAISAFWAGRKYLVPWWLKTEESGGPVNEQATHLIDLCRYLCGEISDIHAALGSAIDPDSPEQLSAALSLRFQNGAFGSLFYSCEAADKQIGIRILAKEGGIVLSSWDLALTANEIDGTGITTGPEDIFVLETRQFLDAVARNNPALVACTFEDAWRTQQTVDRILTTKP